jgi:hypothetical protein
MRRCRLGMAVILGVCCLATAAGAIRNDVKRFAPLTLGQPVAQVQKVYKHMRHLTHEQFGAAVVFSPFIERYYQTGVKMKGLPQPVALELRFWKGKLWVIIAYFGGNSESQILAWLQGRYGKPTGHGVTVSWAGRRITVLMDAKQHWLSVADNAASKEVQMLLAQELRKLQPPRAPSRNATLRAVPTAVPSPLVTPAAH